MYDILDIKWTSRMTKGSLKIILMSVTTILATNVMVQYDSNVSQHTDWTPTKWHDRTMMTCFMRTLLLGDDNENIEITNDVTEGNGKLTCKFNFDVRHSRRFPVFSNNFKRQYAMSVREADWFCTSANKSLLCDGTSVCLTDECGCPGSQVFYCADGSGCVTLNKVCDSVQDCMDGSDECFCAGFIIDNTENNRAKVCLSQKEFCQTKIYLPFLKLKNSGCHKMLDVTNPIYKCLRVMYETSDWLRSSSERDINTYCKKNCSHLNEFLQGNWSKFCDQVKKGYPYDLAFSCNHDENYHITTLCDNEINCSDGSDEIGCPGRFYCDSNKTTDCIELDKVCDHVKDCKDGSDECATCKTDLLSSSEFLIQSRIIVVSTGTLGILIVLMNSMQIYKCYNMTCTLKYKYIDRLFLLQIFFYDFLMGVYLCGIVISALFIWLKDKYCLVEREWRSSIFCSVFGVLFSSSAHGSLLAISLMSITRYITCRRVGVTMNSRSVIMASVITNLGNWLHSLVPLLPFTEIKEIFRTEIFIKNLDKNPFFNKNPINRSHLSLVYDGMFQKNNSMTGVYDMIEHLRNITSEKDIFDITDISYYGNTGLCIHNIFKSNESLYYKYKISYCICLCILLVIISTSYIKILIKQRGLRQVIAQVEGLKNIHEGDQASMTLKIAVIIGSQIVCWTSLIITLILFEYIIKTPAPPMVFEVFGLIVIPLNSLINPILYSGIYKKAVMAFWRQWRNLVNIID